MNEFLKGIYLWKEVLSVIPSWEFVGFISVLAIFITVFIFVIIWTCGE